MVGEDGSNNLAELSTLVPATRAPTSLYSIQCFSFDVELLGERCSPLSYVTHDPTASYLDHGLLTIKVEIAIRGKRGGPWHSGVGSASTFGKLTPWHISVRQQLLERVSHVARGSR